jgi:hypothetical protein
MLGTNTLAYFVIVISVIEEEKRFKASLPVYSALYVISTLFGVLKIRPQLFKNFFLFSKNWNFQKNRRKAIQSFKLLSV